MIDEQNDFLAFLKRYSIPVAALLYILAFLVQLKEYADKIGLKVLAIAVLIISVAWAVYVWTAKRVTVIEPVSILPKFSKRVRLASLLSIPLAAIPVWFSLQPAKPFSIPQLAIKIVNKRAEGVGVSRVGEFYVTAPATPATDDVVANGRFRLHQRGETSESSGEIVVPASGELMLFAEFLNPTKFKPLLDGGDLSFRVIVWQADGHMLTEDGIPFDAKQISKGYIKLEAQ
jgi:hypothetical protein